MCILCDTLVRDMTLTNVAAACKWHHAIPIPIPIRSPIPRPSPSPNPGHIGGDHATRFPVIIHYPNARSMPRSPESEGLSHVCMCTGRLDYAFNLRRTLLDFS